VENPKRAKRAKIFRNSKKLRFGRLFGGKASRTSTLPVTLTSAVENTDGHSAAKPQPKSDTNCTNSHELKTQFNEAEGHSGMAHHAFVFNPQRAWRGKKAQKASRCVQGQDPFLNRE